MSTPSQSPRAERARYRPRQRTAWQRVPLSVKIAVPALLAIGSWTGFRAWQQSRTLMTFVGDAGAAVPALDLTFFPEQFSFTAPSPPEPMGALRVEGDEVVIDRELVPDVALVRYSGAGIGTGFTRVVRGQPCEPVRLARPTAVPGRVGVPSGFFALGLRSLGFQPVVGARVFALGGGEHGVLLGEAVTDADGRFQLDGIAGDLPILGVRVLAPGYAVAFTSCFVGGDRPILAMVPTQPIDGIVQLPDGVAAAGLRVLAKGLPGVESRIAADGSFRIDHVPPNLEPRLLVHGLPPGWTHTSVHASPGDHGVRLTIVHAAALRGRVIDRMTQQPIAGAMVWHEHGPAGWVSTESDDSGAFVLERTPPGTIELRAQHETKDPLGRSDVRTGERRIVVEEGKDLDGVLVRID